MVQQGTETLHDIPTTNLFLGNLTKTCEIPSLKNGVDSTAALANVVPAYLFRYSFWSDNCEEAAWSGGKYMATAFNDAEIFAF